MARAAEGRGVAIGQVAVQIYPANAVRNLVVLFRWKASNGKGELQVKKCRRATVLLYNKVSTWNYYQNVVLYSPV
jgi:hypothetical protein